MCDSKVMVSIIMGAYNVSSLSMLDKAIESILLQSLSDFEFIICDDGSTDDTWNRLNKFMQKDSRIRLLRNKKNQGLAAALNHCLRFAQGEFIARQDADDISDPYRLEKQVRFLKQHENIGFVGTNCDLFDENGIWRNRCFPEFPTKKDFLFTLPFVHGSLLFRREILLNNPYKVSKETRRTEDYELLMRLYARRIRGGNLQEALYLFQENRTTRKRRKFCYRIDEAKVKWRGFYQLGLMPQGLPYVVKPIIVGMIPQDILRRLKKKRVF